MKLLLSLQLLLITSTSTLVLAFSSAFTKSIFQETKALQKLAPSKTAGIEIELPDFDEFFNRIQVVSPLARLAINGGGTGEGGGFAIVDDTGKRQGIHNTNIHLDTSLRNFSAKQCLIIALTRSSFLSLFPLPIAPSGYKWKNVEKNKNKVVRQIDRIDNFQNLGPPLLRWRASMTGPCDGLLFADFIMNTDKRRRWDPQIESVSEMYPIIDLETANIAMGNKFGDCLKLGAGYTLTKSHPIGISPREQLTLCGIQNFMDGSSVIWGTELAEWHNHLLPAGERLTRARSHLFSIALVPTGNDTFDVEYSLQLDFGGSLPHWMTSPIVIDSVKGMFGVAQEGIRKK